MLVVAIILHFVQKLKSQLFIEVAKQLAVKFKPLHHRICCFRLLVAVDSEVVYQNQV
jgi:hypothetical protein